MEGKRFRGEAGEVVRGYLGLATALTCIPVVIIAVAVTLTITVIAARFEMPDLVAMVALALVQAPLVGLFAMASRAGHPDSGFFESLSGPSVAQVPGFCLRYSVLTLAFLVPLDQAMKAAAKAFAPALLQGPGSAAFVAAIWVSVALVAACVVLPILALLVATRTDSLGEAFSGRAWRWVFAERGADLVPLMAAAIGAFVMFLLVSVPVAAVLLPVANGISPRLGQLGLVVLPVVALASTPILMGRLVGAFVAAETAEPPPAKASLAPAAAPPQAIPRGPEERAAQEVFSRTQGALAGIPRGIVAVRMDAPTVHGPVRPVMVGQSAAAGVPLGVAVARAHQLAETDVEGALAELDELRAANPRNPAVAGERAKVLRKAGRSDEARQAAGDAIRLALTGGAAPIAHDVFRAFAQEASQLNLEPAIYEQLARILTARREFDAACWCYRAAAVLGGDPKPLQKGMLACAEAALESDDAARAAGIYEAFLKTWPESPLAGYAREGAETARLRSQVLPGG
jgi:hypothetical protein